MMALMAVALGCLTTACGDDVVDEYELKQKQWEEEYQRKLDMSFALMGANREDFSNESLTYGTSYNFLYALRKSDSHVVVMLINSDFTHIEFLNDECCVEPTKNNIKFLYILCEPFLMNGENDYRLSEDKFVNNLDTPLTDDVFVIKIRAVYEGLAVTQIASYAVVHDNDKTGLMTLDNASDFSFVKGYEDSWLFDMEGLSENEFPCRCYRITGELLYKTENHIPFGNSSIPVAYDKYLCPSDSSYLTLYTPKALPVSGEPRYHWDSEWFNRVLPYGCQATAYTVEDRSSNPWVMSCKYIRRGESEDNVYDYRFSLNIETGELAPL